MFQFPLTGLVTLFCLIVLFWMTAMVGKARGKHGVKVPEMTGPEPFQYAMRVQFPTSMQLLRACFILLAGYSMHWVITKSRASGKLVLVWVCCQLWRVYWAQATD